MEKQKKNKAAQELGRMTSEKKAKAARENGKKGGPSKWKSVRVEGSWFITTPDPKTWEYATARASRLNGTRPKKRK